MSDVLLSKINGESFNSELLNLLQFESKQPSKKPYVQRHNDIAILNIEGVLVPKASQLDSMCGLVSTLELHNTYNELVEDSSVNKILLYLDTEGGATVGIPEFAESIKQSSKETIAFTDIKMASAGYCIGSAADKIVATPSSTIGSIGTYMTLTKENKENKETFDTYFIQEGDNKLFGNPKTPISDAELNYFQGKVKVHNDLLISTIANNRNVSADEVRNTKASYYMSANAPEWMVDVLADANYILS